MYLEKRKNGYRAIFYIDGVKQRPFNTGETEEGKARTAAEAHERGLIAQRANEKKLGVSLELGDVATRYFRLKGTTHVGADNTQRLIDSVVGYFKGSFDVERDAWVCAKLITSITHEDVLAMRLWRSKHRVGKRDDAAYISNATINDTIEQLKKLFTFCKEAGVVFDLQTMPKWATLWLKEQEEHVRYLSDDEEARFDDTITDRRSDYYPLIEFARITTLRKMNCVELEWPQVKWDRGVIEIRVKGDKPFTIEITDTVRELLWPLYMTRKEDCGVPEAAIRVFTYTAVRTTDSDRSKQRNTVKGKRYPITKYSLRRVWDTIRKHAGLTGGSNFRFHDIRHDTATRTLWEHEGEGGLKVVQHMLGHADIKTTMKYAHVKKGAVASAQENRAQNRAAAREARKAAALTHEGTKLIPHLSKKTAS